MDVVLAHLADAEVFIAPDGTIALTGIAPLLYNPILSEPLPLGRSRR